MSEGHKLSDDVRNEIKADAEQGSGFNGEFFRAKKPFRAALSKAMPAGAITKHPSKTYLNSIKAIFVIERLNEVFGILGWDFEHEIIGTYDNTSVKDGKTVVQPHVVVRGRIYVREFDLYTPVQYGGQNIDGKGQDPVDGFKSAVTDALTKCASFLEIGIQVFKGAPQSQEANKSKRLEQNETAIPAAAVELPKTKLEEKAASPSSNEADLKEANEAIKIPVGTEVAEDEAEMVELRNLHKELYGKFPNKNWSAELVAERIEIEQKRQAEPPKEEPVIGTGGIMSPSDDFEAEAKSYEPMNEEAPEVEVEDEVEETVEEAETVKAEDVKIDHVSKAKADIDTYLDPNELKEAASVMVFDARLDGADDDEINEIKKLVNVKYKSLI